MISCGHAVGYWHEPSLAFVNHGYRWNPLSLSTLWRPRDGAPLYPKSFRWACFGPVGYKVGCPVKSPGKDRDVGDGILNTPSLVKSGGRGNANALHNPFGTCVR